MGLIASVYRTGVIDPATGLMRPQDCTLLGWSSRFDRVCVVNIDGPFSPSAECPAVVVVRHRSMPALHAVLLDDYERKRWTMMGGNFLYTSDSRFSEACNNIMCHGNEWPRRADHKYPVHANMSFHAIPIHDRIE